MLMTRNRYFGHNCRICDNPVSIGEAFAYVPEMECCIDGKMRRAVVHANCVDALRGVHVLAATDPTSTRPPAPAD